MLDVLFKKACGYTVTETVMEYNYDEQGEEKLVKKKVQKKYIPPDMTAIKTYMESKDSKLYEMSEEELEKEKLKLLLELQKIQRLGEENEKKEC